MNMAERDFDKLGNIQSALETLRQYNQYVLFPVDESVFENPALEEYFNSPLNAPIERDIEKIICVAGINAVYDNPNIPAINKKRSARNTARDLREAMRYAKLEYHAAEKELTHKEYNRRKRAIPIVRRRMKVQMAKTLAKNTAITAIATVVAGPIGGGVVLGERLLWRFMPDELKKPIQKTAKEVKEKAVSVLERSVDYIKSTSVGKVVQKAIDVVKPTVTKVVDTAKKGYDIAKDFVKSFWPF